LETTATVARLVWTPEARAHGRCLVELPDGPGPHPLLVGFHGYGENAERHLDALRTIPGTEGWARCAVQGLHRFYNTKTGEVVAGWMTKQDRELAIADNIAYVGGVVAAARRELPVSGTLVYFGYSQGVAMAYRAAAAGPAAAGLVALAGDVPPDVAEGGLASLPPALIARGRDDEWYSQEKMGADVERLRGGGVVVETLVYDGGHEWSDAFRAAAAEFLRRRR
jgi:predicted esterase